MKTFAIGAYSTDNLGDDSILAGLRRIVPDVIPIAHGYLRGNSLFILDALDGYKFESDNLIIGGGGIFYSKEAIESLYIIAKKIKDSGGRVEIRGCGFEDYNDNYHEVVSRLINFCDRITFRTQMSLSIFKKNFDAAAEIERDFSSLLFMNRFINYEKASVIRVGIVTTGAIEHGYEELIRLIDFNKDIQFFHIPHSRARRGGWLNNDMIVGEYIHSSLTPNAKTGFINFQTSVWFETLDDLFEKYEKMDAVISYRFHGVLFASYNNLPCAVMRPDSLKQKSSMEYHKDSFMMNNFDDMNNFLNTVRERRVL